MWKSGRLLALALLAGCAGRSTLEPLSLHAKLAQVGLEPLSEQEAQIPPSERGHFVPVRVLAGFPIPALPRHPAGYLLVGIDGRVTKSADVIRDALRAWKPGEVLKVTARRNPYRLPATEWWEVELDLLSP